MYLSVFARYYYGMGRLTMKKWVNGQIIEMTPEEIAEAKSAQEEYEKQLASQPPTYEDRLSALESALLEMITGGETDG